jgi:integrase
MSAEDAPDEVSDPVGHFLDDMTYHGKSERTRGSYERVLREFESFLASRDGDGGVHLSETTHRDCLAWIHDRRGAVAPSTVATYASYLHRFYDYMVQVGIFDSNPMALVVEEMDETIDTDPDRRELSVPEMRSFVGGLSHPLDRAVVVTLLKTGMRAGELCNLDLRDVAVPSLGDLHDEPTRPQLNGRDGAIYVSPEPARNATVNGERRTASNKRKRPTVIPADGELAGILERWLAIRPDPVSPAEPLFVSTADNWGRRLEPEQVHHLVTDHAADAGWYRPGSGAEENVTPHYFRHFFTTHLRDRTGDRGIVKYLRGDVAGDVIDTYTHDWGDRVRETYVRHIYSLLP